MDTVKKAVTCHAGARDGYYLSSALHEINCLEKFVTDYYTPDSMSPYIKRRHSARLPSSKTKSIFSNLIRERIFGQNFAATDKILSQRAFRTAIQTQSNLFLTSYTAYEAFEAAKAFSAQIKKILFQIHPHPLSIRNIFEEELILNPQYESSLLSEHEMQVNNDMVKRLHEESQMADAIVVASNFTKKTLVDNKIDPSKVTVIPYGVSPKNFPQKNFYKKNNQKLNVLFLGQMIQRKGLSYLLNAINELNTSNVELTLVGRGRFDECLIKEVSDTKNVRILRNLKQSELANCLHQHDVLVLPSLAEGFGHVILEAMCSGLPVICTDHTAGPDLFKTGDEGIIVPIRDAEAIAVNIEAFIACHGKIEHMGRQAANTARSFTWEKHCDKLKEFYKNRS